MGGENEIQINWKVEHVKFVNYSRSCHFRPATRRNGRLRLYFHTRVGSVHEHNNPKANAIRRTSSGTRRKIYTTLRTRKYFFKRFFKRFSKFSKGFLIFGSFGFNVVWLILDRLADQILNVSEWWFSNFFSVLQPKRSICLKETKHDRSHLISEESKAYKLQFLCFPIKTPISSVICYFSFTCENSICRIQHSIFRAKL